MVRNYYDIICRNTIPTYLSEHYSDIFVGTLFRHICPNTVSTYLSEHYSDRMMPYSLGNPWVNNFRVVQFCCTNEVKYFDFALKKASTAFYSQ